jgi:hypothetical protein
MKTELFTCQMTAEEVKKRERSMTLMLRVCFVSLFILCPVIVYLSGAFSTPLDSVGLVFIIFICAMMAIFLWLIFCSLKYVIPKKYAQMADKQFGYDIQTEKFFYKDNTRELTFTANQIEKWYSMTGRYGETTDIFLLPDEDPIVLESEFNSKVHNFLQFHKEMYHLPQPRSMWLRMRYYDR